MSIAKDTVVSFHYRLRDESNEELESSHGGDPMAYLHGHSNIIAGLESALEGHEKSDVFSATIAPEDGYGLRQEDATQRVPLKHLMGDKKQHQRLKAGDVVSINTDDGARQVVVIKAGKFNIDVDTNHPLAGKTLSFDIEILDIRDATSEEVAHGHAHGIGGHQH